jgi:hypothetical protein
MGYLGLVNHMGLMSFLRPKGERRGMDLLRDEGKPAGGAFWADEPTASWPSPPAAKLTAADPTAADPTAPDPTAPDRRRAGRHAAPRNPGHHGGAGQHARASLAALAFG